MWDKMFIQLNYSLFNHIKLIQSENVAGVKNQKASIQLSIYDTENVTQLNISVLIKPSSGLMHNTVLYIKPNDGLI